ncbi:hypothetical protein [Pontiella agarivorans]|uniref:Uncharacterized protein n=1 Tax=Pontiella agarivorans TaxID=3038953 RepID=A0ABU5MWZ1_9BACT|nr:hypothetical protein [Pontiella agarivorans]MDZ8118733.1 hypothetical protein [Pontiella agarivorans]
MESIKEVRIHSIVNWRKDLIDEKYVKDSYPDTWEVPLLELVTFDQTG